MNKMETSCKASHYYPVSSCIFLIPIYRDFRGVSQMLQEHEDKKFYLCAGKNVVLDKIVYEI